MKYLLFITVLAGLACQPSLSEPEHAHAPDGSHISSSDDRPSKDTTLWTARTELFVEYPALVVDRNSRFAAHFTVLQNHQPVREGRVTVSIIKAGKGIRHSVRQPASPGIFTPVLQPKEPGLYELVFDLELPQYQDRFSLGMVEVFSTAEEAAQKSGTGEEAGGTISFLKEQAWKIPFQTTPVQQGEIFDIIHTSGQWMTAPGDFQRLTANVSGVIRFANTRLTTGRPVKKGQILLSISSQDLTNGNLQAEIQKAQANFDQAKAEYDRNKQLFESRIVPRSVFEKVENQYRLAQTNLETLTAGYNAGGKQIRAPFDGFVKSVDIVNGEFVEQGTALLSIGADRSRLLKMVVSPSDAPQLQQIQDIWYQGENLEWKSMAASGGNIQSIGKEVSPETPLLPVYAQVNDANGYPEGSFAEVQIQVGRPRQGILVPSEALLEDYGQYAVMVQLSGETFERRSVRIGRKNAAYVEIVAGLQAGEQVVSEGAYQVKMASMSSQVPAHGHAH